MVVFKILIQNENILNFTNKTNVISVKLLFF